MNANFVFALWHHGTFMQFHSVEGPMTIGRSKESDIFLGDGSVSRCHARVDRTDSDWMLHDLGSHNGTFVNRQRIADARVDTGAIIQIGAYDLIACLAGDEQRIVSAFEQETGPTADPGTTGSDPQVRLTPKQQPVFEELIAGRSKKEISRFLRISINTVRYHSKQIYKAFDVSSLGELLAALIKRKSPMT